MMIPTRILLQKMPSVAALPVSNLSDYVGTYYSDELGVSWTLEARNGELIRTQWMFPAQALKPILPDTFSGDLSEGGYALKVQSRCRRSRQWLCCGHDDGSPAALFALRARKPARPRTLVFGLQDALPAPQLMGIAEFIIMT